MGAAPILIPFISLLKHWWLTKFIMTSFVNSALLTEELYYKCMLTYDIQMALRDCFQWNTTHTKMIMCDYFDVNN